MVSGKRLQSMVTKVMNLVFGDLNPQIVHEQVGLGRIATAITLGIAEGFMSGLKSAEDGFSYNNLQNAAKDGPDALKDLMDKSEEEEEGIFTSEESINKLRDIMSKLGDSLNEQIRDEEDEDEEYDEEDEEDEDEDD